MAETKIDCASGEKDVCLADLHAHRSLTHSHSSFLLSVIHIKIELKFLHFFLQFFPSNVCILTGNESLRTHK